MLLGPLCLPVPCMPGFTLRPDGPVILLQRGWYCPASSEELCTWGQDEDNWLVGPQTSGSQRAWPHPRPTNAKVGVLCCGVWRHSAVGEPKKCCHPIQPGLCLPNHFLHRLPNCPPSWFISVEIWEQVEDSLVSAFLHLELNLVPFVLNFFVCVVFKDIFS